MPEILAQIYWRTRNWISERWLMGLRFLESYRYSVDLHCVQDHTGAITSRDILLFAVLRNEAVRIPFFLDYYRKLGVNHFLIVDNGSDDGFRELVRNVDDVSVWHTERSYRRANFGMHWVNYLLRKYGTNHWCVTCDPDEFLVYPNCDTRQLSELAAFLETEERRSLFCVMLDMYGSGSILTTKYRQGDDPFEIAPYFDPSGYVQKIGWLRESWVTGGVRRRVFFSDIPWMTPSLNKTPFVKWRWSYSYYLSMHQLVPCWLNEAHAKEHNSVTGCLMHFKYFSLLKQKVAEEMHRKEHWDNSFEYRTYDKHLGEDDKVLFYEKSAHYEGWRQLVDMGVMNCGRWF